MENNNKNSILKTDVWKPRIEDDTVTQETPKSQEIISYVRYVLIFALTKKK